MLNIKKNTPMQFRTQINEGSNRWLLIILSTYFFSVVVLGNHDYRGDVEAQLSPILRKVDNRWLCLRSFILNAGKDISLKLLFRPVKKLGTHRIFVDLDLIYYLMI